MRSLPPDGNPRAAAAHQHPLVEQEAWLHRGSKETVRREEEEEQDEDDEKERDNEGEGDDAVNTSRENSDRRMAGRVERPCARTHYWPETERWGAVDRRTIARGCLRIRMERNLMRTSSRTATRNAHRDALRCTEMH